MNAGRILWRMKSNVQIDYSLTLLVVGIFAIRFVHKDQDSWK
jgi:hypothetical protein